MRAGLDLARNTGECVSAIDAHALWAETYDQPTNPLLALEERTMGALLPELTGKNILDLACGTGRWLERLLNRGPCRGIGVDLSKEMLDVASSKPALSRKLVRADCLALPIRDGILDLSICSFAASYSFNLSALAGELARVSCQAAHVFISDFHPSGHGRGWKRSFRHEDRVVEIASFAYSIGTICEAFENAGFSLLRRVEPHIGEPERGFFAEAGKLQLFDSICESPAIFILHFQFSERQGNPGQEK